MDVGLDYLLNDSQGHAAPASDCLRHAVEGVDGAHQHSLLGTEDVDLRILGHANSFPHLLIGPRQRLINRTLLLLRHSPVEFHLRPESEIIFLFL